MVRIRTVRYRQTPLGLPLFPQLSADTVGSASLPAIMCYPLKNRTRVLPCSADLALFTVYVFCVQLVYSALTGGACVAGRVRGGKNVFWARNLWAKVPLTKRSWPKMSPTTHTRPNAPKLVLQGPSFLACRNALIPRVHCGNEGGIYWAVSEHCALWAGWWSWWAVCVSAHHNRYRQDWDMGWVETRGVAPSWTVAGSTTLLVHTGGQ